MMQRNVKAVVLVLGLALASATAGAKSVLPGSLLEVDQNRGAIVESIVGQWSGALDKSAGITQAQLRQMLKSLRADHLLAASLASSLDGLRDVIAISMASSAPVNAAIAAMPASGVKASAGGPDALGNPSADLVYTPVTPCRLFDTRASQGGMGTPALNVRRTYGAIVPVVNQGGPGGCAAPAGATVALMVIGTLTPSGAGLLQGGPQGVASFPNALILYQPGDQYGTSIAMPLNPANGQFDLVEQSATADLYGDLLGYFRAPQGGYVASVGAGTGVSVTGSALAPIVNVSTSFRLPQSCTNGAMPVSNGAGVWNCGPELLWAVVNSDGTIDRSNRTVSASNVVTGAYEVIFDRNLTTCVYTATIGQPGAGSTSGQIDVASRSGNANGVFVDTRDVAGTLANRPFHLLVTCP